MAASMLEHRAGEAAASTVFFFFSYSFFFFFKSSSELPIRIANHPKKGLGGVLYDGPLFNRSLARIELQWRVASDKQQISAINAMLCFFWGGVVVVFLLHHQALNLRGF